MATTITRYVNTDSTAGGDGTTNGTAGANRAYATLNEALDANPRDLVAADEEDLFICSGSAEDTVAPTVSSTYVCDVNHKVIIRAAASHGGKWNTSTYRMNAGTFAAVWCPINTGTNVQYVQWEGIQFRGTPSNSASSSRHFFEAAGATIAAGSRWRFTRCIFRQDFNSGYTAGTCRCIRVSDADLGVWCNNCIFYDWQGQALSFSTSSISYVFNCTFVNIPSAIGVTGGVQMVRNCIFDGCSSVSSGTLNAGSNYNSTDLSSGPTNFGANSRLSQTFTFVDETNKDYHLQSSDAGAKGFGEDLSAGGGTTGLFDSTDIDGETRVAPWDIGADYFIASLFLAVVEDAGMMPISWGDRRVVRGF